MRHAAAQDRGIARQHDLHRGLRRHGDLVVVQRVFEQAGIRPRQRMPRVDHGGEVVGAVGAGLEAFQVGRVPADAQWRGAVAQRAHHVAAQALLDCHAHVAVRRQLHEGGDVVRQRFRHGRHRGEEAYLPAHAGAVVGHVARHAAGRGEHRARMRQHDLAGRRGDDAAAAAFQQRGADGLFQLRQALADGGSDDVFLLARARHVAGFADGDEQAQRGEVEISHDVGGGVSGWECYARRQANDIASGKSRNATGRRIGDFPIRHVWLRKSPLQLGHRNP
ncbi:hypothetical protein D9M68_535550 [compost metagenome]